jgi:hypothetical protein
VTVAKIDCRRITNWDTFHDVFAEVFGFPGFYGRNLDAWIDCMTYLDEPEAGMSSLHTGQGQVVTLQLENVDDLATRSPMIYEGIIEATHS